jgi:cell division septum initiation protein DivIVA
MKDVAREKYQRLMAEIEDLEQQVESLTQEQDVAKDSPEPQDAQVIAETLRSAQEKLADRRNELARLSDGCGRPHPQ